MRRITKQDASRILEENLKYTQGNKAINGRITKILLLEQKGFCAYTDEYISRTDAKDIEHFDPTLKGTDADSYNNWFIVKHQWNKEKSYKWDTYQPILHPVSPDFEERVIYNQGDYFALLKDDIEAKNLVSLLKLDDVGLADKRKKYIARKQKEIKCGAIGALEYFQTLINDEICQVSYLRSIREEFGIDLWNFLPE